MGASDSVVQNARFYRSPEIYDPVIPNGFIRDTRILLTEDDEVVRGLVSSTRYQQSICAQERAGLGNFLRARVFTLPLQIAQSSVGGRVQAGTRQFRNVTKANYRVEGYPQFV